MVGKVQLMERNGLMVVLLAKSRRKVVNGSGGDRGCFGFASGDLWLTDGGRCLGFDGRQFMIRLVVVASGSVTKNESRQPWTVAAG